MKKAFKPLFDLAKKVQKNLGSDSEADQEFIEKIKEQIEDFKKSRQRTLHLEPMNSYERRLVHNLAPEFGLSSYSEGEEDERHLVLSKDKKAAEEEQTEERPKRRAKVEPEPEKESRPARSPRREHSTNSRARKTEEPAETDNEEFLAELKQEVAKFQKSKEKVHHLAPMNSYQRMLVHTLAKELELFSASEGDEERHIVLYKEEPPKSAERRPPAEKRDREEPRERKPFARREGRADEGRDRDRGGDRDFRSRRPRDDRNAVAEGDREFFVPIQENGVEVILDDTGFVGLEGANPSAQVVDRKHVKLGSFKVRDGKIVTIEDKEW